MSIKKLLAKPVRFNMLENLEEANVKNNIKILATVLLYIVRLVNDNTEVKMVNISFWLFKFYKKF